METKIIRSSKRKKTIQAKVVNGLIHVYLPAGLSLKDEEKYVEKMVKKIENKKLRSKLNKDSYLGERFNYFSKKYFNGELKVNSIKYVTNQNCVIGSCTPLKKSIRISHTIASMPKWVLDYVIMHEMTHLKYPNHSKEFWLKVNEYKYTERAKGFLIAKGMEDFSSSNINGS